MTDLAAAAEFIELFHAENPDAGPVHDRIAWIRAEIDETGTYRHTEDELTFGARVAWRNSARCIGRLYWKSLRVRDLRSVRDASSIAEHCAEHLRLATNNGKIRPVMSVFAPDRPEAPAPRIYNDQLIRYAGYGQPDGTVVGDPLYTGFTTTVTAMGWEPPTTQGAFDILPLLIETRHEGQQLFTLPREVIREVPLRHPDFAWFAELGLRWHAVPAISNMRLDIGGVSYPAAPFNGWYMGTEIGARNLTDIDRYNLLEVIAERLGLDTSDDRTLWRDRAAVEINRAVLHSYAEDGVTITDHHSESRHFLAHVAKEERAGRGCPVDWSWIVPPMSGGLTPVFHRYYDDPETTGPQFFVDPEAAQRGQQGGPRYFAEPVSPKRHAAPVLVPGGLAD
ncbi:nitric oxide synthase oxygenase [Kutzneria buriramensis]|uniref:Nitric oxide synthase oxygenase n=1 Tax=Kutzneria buriramensis TaxID=1045776 RepID=A0A3E0HIT6_9PSEU|nr:nitric oxide synthase oxygenase [Kutzneria buriramensis]REH45975.1 nitric-oxide synthase [Kutzneria buriramensis]